MGSRKHAWTFYLFLETQAILLYPFVWIDESSDGKRLENTSPSPNNSLAVRRSCGSLHTSGCALGSELTRQFILTNEQNVVRSISSPRRAPEPSDCLCKHVETNGQRLRSMGSVKPYHISHSYPNRVDFQHNSTGVVDRARVPSRKVDVIGGFEELRDAGGVHTIIREIRIAVFFGSVVGLVPDLDDSVDDLPYSHTFSVEVGDLSSVPEAYEDKPAARRAGRHLFADVELDGALASLADPNVCHVTGNEVD